MKINKNYITTTLVWMLIITSCILTSLFAQTQMYTVNSKAEEPQEHLAIATSYVSGNSNPLHNEGENRQEAQMHFYTSAVTLQVSEDGKNLEIEIPGMLKTTKFDIRNIKGEVYMNGFATENLFSVDISDFESGTYYLILDERPEDILQFEK